MDLEEEKGGSNGRNRKGKHSQHILYEKKSLFSIGEKIEKK